MALKKIRKKRKWKWKWRFFYKQNELNLRSTTVQGVKRPINCPNDPHINHNKKTKNKKGLYITKK